MPYIKDTQDFLVVRLGGDSEETIKQLDSSDTHSKLPFDISIRCKQVPSTITSKDYAFIWLGTNNSKGGATPWIQGLRALGKIVSITGGPKYNDEKEVNIEVKIILPKSLTKKDFVREAGADYIYLSDMPVLGINNYSSQVIQRINPDDESQQVGVLIRAIEGLSPGFTLLLKRNFPELSELPWDKFTPLKDEDKLPLDEQMEIEIPKDDPHFTELLARVKRLLKDNFGGVILRGSPGTSKSWYARRIAAVLAEKDVKRLRFVQFHQSYQYDDFIEGFVPMENGTFQRKDKHFLEICQAAQSDIYKKNYVIVIDEFSRTDPARIFGEALTYIEKTKRGEEFSLASGRKIAIPNNLIIIATMNVWDRGVDEVDAAIERRLASIAMEPRADLLNKLLERNGVDQELKSGITKFFMQLQRDPNPMVHIGHAYFHSVIDESSLHRLWNNQLRFLIERAFPLEADGFKRIEKAWQRLFPEEPAISESPEKVKKNK